MRTDIHKPSSIIPSDYQYVAIWTMNIQGFGDAQFMLAERQAVKAHMERTGGKYSNHEHGGNCDVCGNVQAIYLVLYYHEKTNTYIRVGFDCSGKLGMSGDAKDFNLFRKNVQNAREAQAGKRKAIAILGDAGLSEAWDIYTAETPESNYEESTIRDIVGKLVKYGSVSEKQTAFIGRLLNKITQRPIVEAQRKAEADAAGPVPTGRVTMTGTVLGMKTVEGPSFSYHDNGLRTKVLIKLENGSKVYGPRFDNCEKGETVTFIATVEASKDDAKFGFFKRPTLPKRELTKEEKKAVNKLKKVRKHIEYGADTGAWLAINDLINDICANGFTKEEVAVAA